MVTLIYLIVSLGPALHWSSTFILLHARHQLDMVAELLQHPPVKSGKTGNLSNIASKVEKSFFHSLASSSHQASHGSQLVSVSSAILDVYILHQRTDNESIKSCLSSCHPQEKAALTMGCRNRHRPLSVIAVSAFPMANCSLLQTALICLQIYVGTLQKTRCTFNTFLLYKLFSVFVTKSKLCSI